jgi:hypothetical protein
MWRRRGYHLTSQPEEVSQGSSRTSTQDMKWCISVHKAGGTARAVNAAIVPPEIVFWRIFLCHFAPSQQQLTCLPSNTQF